MHDVIMESGVKDNFKLEPFCCIYAFKLLLVFSLPYVCVCCVSHVHTYIHQ